MGLSLQFVCGNSAEILHAVDTDDFDFIESLESNNKLADFSLHLEPRNLDTLIQVVSAATKIEVSGLREHLLFDSTAIDKIDVGAMKVSPTITRLFASIPEDDAESIARKWYQKLAESYPLEQIEYSQDAAQSVQRMITVCKHSFQNNKDLVHIWFL